MIKNRDKKYIVMLKFMSSYYGFYIFNGKIEESQFPLAFTRKSIAENFIKKNCPKEFKYYIFKLEE